MEEQGINDILKKYKEELASQDEVRILHDWYSTRAYADGEYPDEEEVVKARMFSRIERRLNPAGKSKSWFWIAAAALFLLVGTSLFFVNEHLISTSGYRNTFHAKGILPGKNSAVLTLADGKTILLNQTKMGIVTTDSRLTYSDGTAIDSVLQTKVITALTITTPRGGQYQAVLPDGTHVWLNAGSSIKFPSRFAGNERVVELNGEAYFEVAKLNVNTADPEVKRRMPFLVISNGQQVEVLGTHFNINSYLDETNVKTTLLEGSVRVSLSSGSEIQHDLGAQMVLIPGQQSVFNHGRLLVREVDAEYVIAWKNGKFAFKNEALQSIMRKVARWYNVEVVFQNDQLLNRTFSGKVSRYDDISEVLGILEMTGGAKFEIEGRKITVL